ncbi:MAG: CBS domain-containing protein [Gammaproteobacteria bacterium]
MSFTLAHILKNKADLIHSVASSETVQSAAIKMAEKGIGALLVIDNKRLVGIFTERDIVNKLFVKCLDPCHVTVGELMTRELIFARPTTTIEEAMATFTQYHFRHLPVIDDQRLLGVVSSGDVTKWLLTSKETEIKYLSEYISGEARY